MKMGIIGAIPAEIGPIKELMVPEKEYCQAGLRFLKGRLNTIPAVAVASDIGKVAAAMTAQILIDVFKVEKVLIIGMAGSINSEVRIGDVVLGSELLQYDVSRAGNNRVPPEPARYNSVFYCDRHLVALAEEVIRGIALLPITGNELPRVFTGRILTGDRVVWRQETVQKLSCRFGGLCVEMEGAAVAQVCAANNVPWLVIRSVSDMADANVMEDFASNQAQVCQNLARIGLALAQSL
ncbi:hypothetical protein SY88_00490 [Clostridiales bacterium PH28_bin88]|nr:hypothetical protein SY88_00490 [Clostridiales bacterium PH28_bin88]